MFFKRNWTAVLLFVGAVAANAGTVLLDSLSFAEGFVAQGVSADFWGGMSFETDNNNYLLSSVEVSLGQSTATTGTITMVLFSDAGSTPGLPLTTLGSVDDSMLPDLGSSGWATFGFDGGAFALSPNTFYWIVLEGSSTGGLTDGFWQDSFFATGIHPGLQSEGVADPPPNWSTISVLDAVNGFPAMEVDAQVASVTAPEPSTLVLIAAPIAILARRRYGSKI